MEYNIDDDDDDNDGNDNNDNENVIEYFHLLTTRTQSQQNIEREWENELRYQGTTIKESSYLMQLIEKGIPPLLRSRVWPLMIGNSSKITPETFNL